MVQNDLNEFAANLHQEVLQRAGDDENPQFREEAFTEHVLGLLSDHNEASSVDNCYSQGKHGANSWKLSVYSLSSDGTALDLFITRYFGTGQLEELSLPETRRQFRLLSRFLTLARGGFHRKLEESSDAFRPAQLIHAAADRLTTVRLFLLTDGVVKSLALEEEPIAGLDVQYVVWDLDKLSRLQVGRHEPVELDFENQYGGAVPCLEYHDATGEYRTFLAYLPAPLLARIYGEHGQRLLERNVRAYLQARGKVNRGLQQTIRDEPHRFLAYNNGLCCTAAQVRTSSQGNGHCLLQWVRDFQIVNGAQTTASIYHALKKLKQDVAQVIVQVKLTVLQNAQQVAEIVPLISLYANSQNKVNGADFSANGAFHRDLERLSRTVWTPPVTGLEKGSRWYYERARGSYADDKARQSTPARKKAWEQEHPASQKFTKTDLAKFEHAWACLPHLVCLGGEKNFNRFAEGLADEQAPSVDLNYFCHVIARAILFRTTERLFTTLGVKQYRAQSVAYSVAWIAYQSGWRINLDKIWEEQRLSPVLCDAMKVVCQAAHQHISSQSGNQGEACKKVGCWLEFKKQELSLPVAWRLQLASQPFIACSSEDGDLSKEWENVRRKFLTDARPLAELEAITGKYWIASRRTQPVSRYAERTWTQLGTMPGLGGKKLRKLVELLSAAAAER